MKEFTIGKNDAGQRLDRFVQKAAPLIPSSLCQKYIRIKRIKVCGRGARRDYKLVSGDVIQMYVNDEFFDIPCEENAYLKISDPRLDIIYEDDNILLVSKKAGVLCHSDGGFDYSTLIARIQAYLYAEGKWRPREENSFAPALCNRIDRNTQGIVIAAKNSQALRIINEKIKLRELDKYYLAAAHGTVAPAAGRLEGYIFKDSAKNQVYVTRERKPGSKHCATEYRTLENRGGLTLLECRLVTGRTHQIRAQLSDAGYPLLGDGKYGSERQNRLFGEKHQALCSYKLAFSFKSDAGILEYLRNSEFKIHNVDFVEKYFNPIDI